MLIPPPPPKGRQLVVRANQIHIDRLSDERRRRVPFLRKYNFHCMIRLLVVRANQIHIDRLSGERCRRVPFLRKYNFQCMIFVLCIYNAFNPFGGKIVLNNNIGKCQISLDVKDNI